jgi:AraC-like DNA-binding protein
MRGGTAESSFSPDGARRVGESSIAELIAKYLTENSKRALTLSELCSRFYMGKSKLFSIFREFTGTSPMEYHEKKRLAEAKRMLASGSHTVSAVSDALGYSSIHTFSRAFKREVGISPSEYARKINRT